MNNITSIKTKLRIFKADALHFIEKKDWLVDSLKHYVLCKGLCSGFYIRSFNIKFKQS